jgi:hypothetical protein
LKTFGDERLIPFIPDKQKEPELISFTDGLEDLDSQIKLEPCKGAPLDAQNALNLLQSRKENKEDLLALEKVLELDSKIINFGCFTSGRVLGSTLQITNKTGQPQTFTVSVLSEFPKDISPKKMLSSFMEEDLPFKQPCTSVENLYK